MAHSNRSDNKLQAQQRRRARQAAELRANLLKRKEQARSRARRDEAESAGDASEPEETPTGRPGEVA